MTIDRATVQKIANLARIDVPANEEEALASQLNGIFKFIEQLDIFPNVAASREVFMCLDSSGVKCVGPLSPLFVECCKFFQDLIPYLVYWLSHQNGSLELEATSECWKCVQIVEVAH